MAVVAERGGSKQHVDKERIISLALAKLLFWPDEEHYPEVHYKFCSCCTS